MGASDSWATLTEPGGRIVSVKFGVGFIEDMERTEETVAGVFQEVTALKRLNGKVVYYVLETPEEIKDQLIRNKRGL